MIAFSVRDYGAGIPRDYQPSVFERFESRTLGSKHRGAGLGLSIVRSLVELHGGDVALASIEGKGTKVTVRFPATRKATPYSDKRSASGGYSTAA
jgi:signal transduction histidine kinase